MPGRPPAACSPASARQPGQRTAAACSRGPAPEPGRRLREAEVAGFVVLDDAGAGGAVPAGLELGPALEVLEGVAVAGALGAPLGEQAQRAGQLPTGGAQLVGEPGRALGVWLADHQPPALQLFEA